MSYLKGLILLIEADKGVQSLISIVLTVEGYDIISSGSPDVLAELPWIKPDLIIIDDFLPFHEGQGYCRKLKSDASTKTIPLLLISTDTGLSKIASGCMADGFMEMPFEIDHLKNKVKTVIG